MPAVLGPPPLLGFEVSEAVALALAGTVTTTVWPPVMLVTTVGGSLVGVLFGVETAELDDDDADDDDELSPP